MIMMKRFQSHYRLLLLQRHNTSQQLHYNSSQAWFNSRGYSSSIGRRRWMVGNNNYYYYFDKTPWSISLSSFSSNTTTSSNDSNNINKDDNHNDRGYSKFLSVMNDEDFIVKDNQNQDNDADIDQLFSMENNDEFDDTIMDDDFEGEVEVNNDDLHIISNHDDISNNPTIIFQNRTKELLEELFVIMDQDNQGDKHIEGIIKQEFVPMSSQRLLQLQETIHWWILEQNDAPAEYVLPLVLQLAQGLQYMDYYQSPGENVDLNSTKNWNAILSYWQKEYAPYMNGDDDDFNDYKDDDDDDEYSAAQMLEYMQDCNIIPDRYTYTLLINGCGSNVELAESILTQLLEQDDKKVDAILIASVMSAWVQQQQKRRRKQQAQFDNSDIDESIPLRIESLFELSQQYNIQPDIVNFNLIMQAWSHCNNNEKVQEWYQRIIDDTQSTNHIAPQAETIQILLQTAIKTQGPLYAESILRQVQKNNPALVDTQHWNVVLNGLVQQEVGSVKDNNDIFGPQRAQELLQSHVIADPTEISYSTVINGWAKRGDPQRAMDVLNDMIQNHPQIEPSIVVWNTVLSAWCKCKTLPSEVIVDNVKLLFEQLLSQQNPKPTLRTYNIVLQCYSRHGMAQEAEEFLQTMEQGDTILPDVLSYNFVMGAWARQKGQAEHTQEILRDMMVPPNLASYNTVLAAWSNSRSLNAGERGATIMEEILQQQIRPDESTYYRLMSCWVTSNQPQKAEEILDTMTVPPTSYMYTCILSGYCRNGMVEEAENLLFKLLRQNENDNSYIMSTKNNNHHHDRDRRFRTTAQPTVPMFAMILSAYPKLANRSGFNKSYDNSNNNNDNIGKRAENLISSMSKVGLSPSTNCWTSVLECWAKVGNGPRAHEILQRMKQDSTLYPDSKAYAMVLQAWAKYGSNHKSSNERKNNRHRNNNNSNGLEQAHAILHEMEHTPNIIADRRVYTAMIQAWARSKRHDAKLFALELLRKLQQLHQQEGRPDCQPTVYEYNAVLSCLQNNDVDVMEGLLMEMIQEASNNKSATPNATTFGMIFQKLASSKKEPDKVERATRIWNLMQQQGVEPSPKAIEFYQQCQS